MANKRRPLFRRQRAGLPKLILRLALGLVGLWCAGFILFLIAVLNAAPPNPLPPADGIVVLTGGDDRIRAALALLAARDAPLLLISGAGRGTYLGDFTADNTTATTRYAADITLGHMADTTHGNALEAAMWARAHHMKSLIVVTADYHMPRALLELRHEMPAMKLIPNPVRPPAMRGLPGLAALRLLAGEYTKYLVVRAGLGRLAAGLRDSET